MEVVELLRDSSPFFRIDFVGGFFLPGLDGVLDGEFDRGRSPVSRLGLSELRIVERVVKGFLVSPLGFWEVGQNVSIVC